MADAGSRGTVFNSVHPIGDTDVRALPIKDVGPAVGYYTQVLGFEIVSRSAEGAILRRDGAEIGLARTDADPEQASCYFSVDGVESLRSELDTKGIEPSELRIDDYGGNRYRVFFAKEPYGVCFCFGEQVASE